MKTLTLCVCIYFIYICLHRFIYVNMYMCLYNMFIYVYICLICVYIVYMFMHDVQLWQEKGRLESRMVIYIESSLWKVIFTRKPVWKVC